jgi:hypothetical protein
MKNSNDIGNQTRELSARSAEPQLTAPPRAHKTFVMMVIIKFDGHIEGRREEENWYWMNVKEK